MMLRYPGFESVGWALLNSFWQFGLLTLLYVLITGGDSRFTAAARHRIALVFTLAGSCWFVAGLFSGYTAPGALNEIAQTNPSSVPGTNAIGQSLFLQLDRVVAFLPWLYISVLILRTGNVLRGGTKRLTEPDATGIAGPEWNVFFERCRRELGIRREVLLRWTSGPGMARTYGFFLPVVLFPVSLLSRLTVVQVEAILVHELAHIRRNDYLTYLWISFFRFIFYFNPFARFLYDAVSLEREQACDDLVLSRSYPAPVYAQALLALERLRQKQNRLAVAASGHRPRQLAHRIRRIAGLPKAPAPRYPLLRLMMAVWCTAIVVYGFKPADKPDAVKNINGTGSGSVYADLRPLSPALKPAVPLPPPLQVSGLKLSVSHEPVLRLPVEPERAETVKQTPDPVEETISDSLGIDQYDPAPSFGKAEDDDEVNADPEQPAYVARKLSRNFSYQTPEPVRMPKALPEHLQPYVPSSSFEQLVADSVPVIAMQSLQQNKTAVVKLLAKWKALQMQQHISRSLEARYLQLKDKAQRDVEQLPAKKEELRKSMQRLKDQMKIRKAEIDRLAAILADEPVIYI